MSKTIAINAGSSSLKWQLYQMPEEEVLASGIIERIGLKDSISTVKYDGKKESETLDIPNHTVAVKILLEDLLKHHIIEKYDEITGIGHRVVAGGEIFKESAVIGSKEIQQIEDLSALAPLHNPAHVAAIRAFEDVLPDVLNVAVFDTAFHTTMPKHAYLYPIPQKYIFQCLPEDPACWAERVDSILLTASGGPFRTRAPETLAQITPDQACAHPNFSMGRKISVDSATMMNKALEVIEARWLFDLAPEQIKVVIHPQQIIHSMVQFKDASILAQLGTPDMRVPIACGLAWPERIESGASRLDFAALAALTFEEADVRRFPGLHLSWQALNAPEGTTAVLNAANEVAVEAFLTGKLRFDHIHAVNLATLDAVQPSKPDSLESLLALDATARVAAQRAAAALAL